MSAFPNRTCDKYTIFGRLGIFYSPMDLADQLDELTLEPTSVDTDSLCDALEDLTIVEQTYEKCRSVHHGKFKHVLEQVFGKFSKDDSPVVEDNAEVPQRTREECILEHGIHFKGVLEEVISTVSSRESSIPKSKPLSKDASALFSEIRAQNSVFHKLEYARVQAVQESAERLRKLTSAPIVSTETLEEEDIDEPEINDEDLVNYIEEITASTREEIVKLTNLLDSGCINWQLYLTLTWLLGEKNLLTELVMWWDTSLKYLGSLHHSLCITAMRNVINATVGKVVAADYMAANPPPTEESDLTKRVKQCKAVTDAMDVVRTQGTDAKILGNRNHSLAGTKIHFYEQFEDSDVDFFNTERTWLKKYALRRTAASQQEQSSGYYFNE